MPKLCARKLALKNLRIGPTTNIEGVVYILVRVYCTSV